MDGPEDCLIWEGLVDSYEYRLASVPLPEEQGDKGAFPHRSWQGWANIAEDFGIASDYPAFRARQAVKIALAASEDNIKGRYVDSISVDAAITAILSGDIAATQLPNTQQMEHEELLSAPIIVLDEQKRRGKRSEHNYLVMFPGQSQEQGEWFSKGQLKASFPATWRRMLDSWKQKKAAGGGGGAVRASEEEETTTLGGSVQEGGGDDHRPAADADAEIGGGGPGCEHQASVIGGESDHPLDYNPYYQQQQQQHQQMSNRLPSLSPRLLPEPEVPVGGYQRRVGGGARNIADRVGGQLPRVQLYQQPAPQQLMELRPLPSGNQGVFLPATAAAISPSGQLQWPVEAPKNVPARQIATAHQTLPSARVSDMLTTTKPRGMIQKRVRRNVAVNRRLPGQIASAPGPAAVTAAAAADANGLAAPSNGVRVHPLLRKNLEYASKNQGNGTTKQQQQQQQPRRYVPAAAARKAVAAAGEATAVAALEILKARPEETPQEIEKDAHHHHEEVGIEEGKKRRRVLQGPSREPKRGREGKEEVTPLRITAAAMATDMDAAPASSDAEEFPEEGEDIEIVEEPEPQPEPETESLPDTEDGREQDEGEEEEAIEITEEIEEEEEKGDEDSTEMADFEKEPDLSDEEKERRRALRLRLQPESWADVRITGAKHTGEHVVLFLTWKDGYRESFPTPWLRGPNFIHCMNTLIDFYESKTKRKVPKGDTADGGGGGGGEGASKEPEEAGKERSRRDASEGGADSGGDGGGINEAGEDKSRRDASEGGAVAAPDKRGRRKDSKKKKKRGGARRQYWGGRRD